MGVSLAASLAKEEAAEQDVVSQLRLRAGSLERDLLQRSLDGLAPNAKVHCPLAPSASCINVQTLFALALILAAVCATFIAYGLSSLYRKEKSRLHYTFWRQFNEKPSMIPGCSEAAFVL